MIRETGRVIAIEQQANGKAIAQIECISKSACSSCQNKSSCGVGVVAKAFSDKAHQFEVPYQQGMEVNKFVELQINNGDLIKSAVVVYLLPLMFFIGGAVVAKQFNTSHEAITISFAIASAAVGFIFTRLLTSKLFKQKPFDNIVSNKFNE